MVVILTTYKSWDDPPSMIHDQGQPRKPVNSFHQRRLKRTERGLHGLPQVLKGTLGGGCLSDTKIWAEKYNDMTRRSFFGRKISTENLKLLI